MDVTASLHPLPAEPYLALVETTGLVHLRYRIAGRTVDDGRCGVDDNWLEIDLERTVEYDLDRFCRFCFPR